MFRHLLVAMCLVTASCAASTDDAGEDDLTQNGGELRFSDVREFKARRGSACSVFDEWTVDMVGRELRGTACVDMKLIDLEGVRMTTAQLALVRKALFEVKGARRLDACERERTDYGRLEVVRETRTELYVDARAACDSAIPLAPESLDGLFDAIGKVARDR